MSYGCYIYDTRWVTAQKCWAYNVSLLICSKSELSCKALAVTVHHNAKRFKQLKKANC